MLTCGYRTDCLLSLVLYSLFHYFWMPRHSPPFTDHWRRQTPGEHHRMLWELSLASTLKTTDLGNIRTLELCLCPCVLTCVCGVPIVTCVWVCVCVCVCVCVLVFHLLWAALFAMGKERESRSPQLLELSALSSHQGRPIPALPDGLLEGATENEENQVSVRTVQAFQMPSHSDPKRGNNLLCQYNAPRTSEPTDISLTINILPN